MSAPRATGGADLAPRCLPHGAVGICSLALLRKFEQWRAKVEADPSCEFLNSTAWEELAQHADQARTLLAQVQADG